MKSLKDIQSILKSHKKHLFANYPIRSIAIFGSFARNAQTDKSDLDLLVEFNDQIGIRFIDLADEVEKIVGFKVDLVSKNGIKESYFKAINSDLIYV